MVYGMHFFVLGLLWVNVTWAMDMPSSITTKTHITMFCDMQLPGDVWPVVSPGDEVEQWVYEADGTFKKKLTAYTCSGVAHNQSVVLQKIVVVLQMNPCVSAVAFLSALHQITIHGQIKLIFLAGVIHGPILEILHNELAENLHSEVLFEALESPVLAELIVNVGQRNQQKQTVAVVLCNTGSQHTKNVDDVVELLNANGYPTVTYKVPIDRYELWLPTMIHRAYCELGIGYKHEIALRDQEPEFWQNWLIPSSIAATGLGCVLFGINPLVCVVPVGVIYGNSWYRSMQLHKKYGKK